MKEDILRELMIESGFARIVNHPTSPTGTHISIDPEIQKKAEILSELVLKECINMVSKKSGEQITKHFGIK
jgi:predicted glycosyltransferase